ncbi:MAG TPA: hypothetical protein VK109_00495, partial [Enterococcus sp.]|nr:hypothetical protein [Enterococcus sp.]
IVVSKPQILAVCMDTLQAMMDEDTEIITIIIGEEGSESQAKEIEAALLAINDELEIEIHQGDQPVYPYLFSAE